ncbi:MAG: type II secretion system protein [Patescibacteria group bacterium]
MKKTSKIGGFTLIELMIVISIIGLLSSIVLVALGSGRQRGINSNIAQQMAQMRNAIELYRTTVGSYPAALSNLSPTYIKSVTSSYVTYSYSTTANTFSCGGVTPATYIVYTSSYPAGTTAGLGTMIPLTYTGSNCSAGAGVNCTVLANTYCVANR